jgi:hypothetical protein
MELRMGARWRSGISAERRCLKCGFLPKAATSALSRRNQMKAEMGAGIIVGRMSRLQPRQTPDAALDVNQ